MPQYRRVLEWRHWHDYVVGRYVHAVSGEGRKGGEGGREGVYSSFFCGATERGRGWREGGREEGNHAGQMLRSLHFSALIGL
jgi:hypothetical protein